MGTMIEKHKEGEFKVSAQSVEEMAQLGDEITGADETIDRALAFHAFRRKDYHRQCRVWWGRVKEELHLDDDVNWIYDCATKTIRPKGKNHD
jgi:hypothetical protein